MTSSPPAIRVRHLSHRFGMRDVLRDVSFDVPHGEICGFIGPNGAGKTTTIRVMATLLEPATGRVEIDGHDVSIDPDRVRRVIGYMPDHAGVYERITVREFLEFFADAYQVPDPGVVDVVLELTDLSKLDSRLVAELSKGMKQRLQVARILLHDPKVLILDEPASDLDPRARIELRDLLLELRDLGKTIFLSSHILTELSDVCTSVGILEQGRLVVAGPIAAIGEELARRSRGPQVASAAAAIQANDTAASHASGPGTPAVTAGGVEIPAAARKRLKLRVLGDSRLVVPLLAGGLGVHAVDPGAGGMLTVDYSGDERFVADVVRHLVGQGVALVGVEPERNELERIFLEVPRGDLQ
jgi:ABC-2 type transport system ATP-binding protein